MQPRPLEELLAYHCGPAFAGIKASNLLSCSKSDYPDLRNQLGAYNTSLNRSGIFFEILCECSKSNLLFVYRKPILKAYLNQPAAKRILHELGYPVSLDTNAVLAYLKKRIQTNPIFPHEIGLFLGYPIEDVLGFLEYKGKQFKLNGYWKVYSDVQRAQALFESYRRCRDLLCRRISEGMSLIGMFEAA